MGSKCISRRCFVALATNLCVALSFTDDLLSDRLHRPANEADAVHQLWAAVVDPSLQRNVQSDQEAYNDGHILMVPLHAAFRRGDAAWEHSFSDHFGRLVHNPSVLPKGDLARVQYVYLASEFIVLAKKSGHEDLIPAGLPDLLFSEVRSFWQVKPAWHWAHAFPGGFRERLAWKLNNGRVEKSYYRAINDDELFLLAVAADLKAYGGTPAQQQAWNPMLEDMLAMTYRTLSQEVVSQPGGEWLLQPGAWADHPEYQYAGNKEARPGIKPAPVRGIAWDTSHFMRFPLWVTSYMNAYPANSDRYRFYEGLRRGLEKQFFNRVLVRPTSDFPCYRTNNYMDASNGVYRWNYQTLGSGTGYGPYGLSGTLLLGWWAFLDTDPIRATYHELATTFPWTKRCVELYLGPTPSGTHPESQVSPDSSSMRLWHLLVTLASEV